VTQKIKYTVQFNSHYTKYYQSRIKYFWDPCNQRNKKVLPCFWRCTTYFSLETATLEFYLLEDWICSWYGRLFLV